MDKILEFLRTYFGSVLKMPEQELTALFNADSFDPQAALTAITEKDRGRIAQFQGKFQEGKNAGKAEALTALESELITKFGFEQNAEKPLKGLELIDAIVAQQATEGAQKAGVDPSKLTTEDLKQLPAFQPIQREFNSQLNKVKTEAEAKVKEVESGYQKKEVFAKVSKSALDVLNSLNPVLPQTPTVAEKQKSSFLNELAAIEWQEQDGQFLPVKDGKVMDDGHGNALTLEGLAKQKASEWFEFAANNGGGNAGNGKAGEDNKGAGATGGFDAKGYPKGITPPKNIGELTAIVNDPKIKPEDKQAATIAFEKEFESH